MKVCIKTNQIRSQLTAFFSYTFIREYMIRLLDEFVITIQILYIFRMEEICLLWVSCIAPPKLMKYFRENS